jgi:threonine dehydratase
VDDVVTVTDAEIVSAMRLSFERLKVVVEPSGAAALAAVLSEQFKSQHSECKRVAVVLSGGNVDFERVGFFEKWTEVAKGL